jgi:DNA-binding beta-propeller fold protein YncE
MGSSRVRRVLLPALIAVLGLVWAGQASALERIGQYGIGLPGPGGGQIGFAYGTGVSPDGTVVVADLGNQRLSAFSQAGNFLWAAGKNVSLEGGTGAEICTTACRAGESGIASGELGSPFGLAAGATEIYVPEAANQRVSVFNYQGQFLRAFGQNVGGAGINVCTAVCGPGTAGIGGGQMASPAGVALDAGGNLYLSELGTARIDVFNPQTGVFIRAFGKNVGGAGVNTCTTACMSGTADGSPGSINSSYDLSISSAGELFVAEAGANRVSVFDPQSGQFLRAIGGPGSGAGQLSSPFGVAVADDGNVYVADTSNNRLSVFGVDGSFRKALGLDVIPGPPVQPETCTSVCQAGAGGNGIGEFSAPQSISTDCRGAVYIGNIGRLDKFGELGARKPPCPSNAFSFGKTKKNKKKGTLTVDVTVSGPGTLVASVGKKLSAKVPQPTAAGVVRITVKAAGKGVKALKRKGKLKGKLTLTFTPPNGDPNTQSKSITLVKKLKKHKKAGKR